MWPISIDKIVHLLAYNPKEPLIFSSGFFIWWFLLFISGFALVQKQHRAKIIFVTLFSLFFYYKSSGVYFLVLIGSTLVDYYLAKKIYETPEKNQKKLLLVLSLVLNLGLLAYFKYTNFLYDMFCGIVDKPFTSFDIFLPVGVSFFTFQSLSYTIDIYRGELKPVKNLLDYSFFVSFFPQLVAGPIVRAKDFIPQIERAAIVTQEMFGRGVFLIIIGLFKKAVISDYISINFVDRIFDNPNLYTGLENLFGVYGYALQIYCDFSGYSDMAIGIALLFGYRLCLNFDSPYQSQNITEFWRRWHISLSTWLRDYLYISLGGNRKGKIRTYLNQFITMVLGGLWHGASLRFVLWGALHGAALIVHKLFVGFSEKRQLFNAQSILAKRLISVFSIVFTFHFVCFCWIFFRADDMEAAIEVLNQIFFKFSPGIFVEFVRGYSETMWLMLLGFILHFMPKSTEQWALNRVTEMPLIAKATVLVLVIFLVIQIKSSDIQPFIYFQF